MKKMKTEINLEIVLTKSKQILEKIKDKNLRKEIMDYGNMSYELGRKDTINNL